MNCTRLRGDADTYKTHMRHDAASLRVQPWAFCESSGIVTLNITVLALELTANHTNKNDNAM